MKDIHLKDLIHRVGEDVSQLKRDVSSLFGHTGRHALPERARELGERARHTFHAGGDYIRRHPTQSSLGLVGGLALLGAVGFGIYCLCKSDCCRDGGRDEN